MVNYFKIINLFWDTAPDLAGYKTDHSAVFFAVVDSINRNGWKDTEIEYDRMINKVRLGKKNYLAARHWLAGNRFIRFTAGRGDYAKAKFGLGDAVLGRTAPNTPNDPLPEPDEVLPKTASGTASDTATPENAVPDRTASDTASDTAPGTASNTHLIEVLITTNDLLLTQQQQQQTAEAEIDGGGGDEKKTIEDSDNPKSHPDPATPPTPPPSADEVRAELLKSTPHRRYAFEQLKLVRTDPEYAELVEIHITQRECDSAEGMPAFKSIRDARRHFMNWLGTRNLISSQKTNGNANGNSTNKRTAGALRPTAIGHPDYRGTGSTCNVDL